MRKRLYLLAMVTGLMAAGVPSPGAAWAQPASNINSSDTKALRAPKLPAPTDPNGSPQQLLEGAKQALARGQSGVAQEALERAETRLLGRPVSAPRAGQPDQNPVVRAVASARQALAAHDTASAIGLVNVALQGLAPPPYAPPPYAALWQPGYWRWGGLGYVWVPGHYLPPPGPAVAAGWHWTGSVWIWAPVAPM